LAIVLEPAGEQSRTRGTLRQTHVKAQRQFKAGKMNREGRVGGSDTEKVQTAKVHEAQWCSLLLFPG